VFVVRFGRKRTNLKRISMLLVLEAACAPDLETPLNPLLTPVIDAIMDHLPFEGYAYVFGL
jgi:hypothetical protein